MVLHSVEQIGQASICNWIFIVMSFSYIFNNTLRAGDFNS